VRRAHLLLAVTLACACLPATVFAAQSVTLNATLTPERLGQPTTITFGFQIAAPSGHVPPPLTEIDVDYPNDLGIALSGVGLATCTRTILEASGPQGCPADSRMGYGTALAEIAIGPAIIDETAEVSLVRGPTQSGHLALLFYVNGEAPVSAQLVLPGLILPIPAPFGGRINVIVPLIPSLPEAPDVAVTELRSTIGPQHLTYYEQIDGHDIAYHPKGILLPNNCPHGGFPFAANLTFLDHSHAAAHTVVACPRKTRGR
jgi:hypothetical protein